MAPRRDRAEAGGGVSSSREKGAEAGGEREGGEEAVACADGAGQRGGCTHRDLRLYGVRADGIAAAGDGVAVALEPLAELDVVQRLALDQPVHLDALRAAGERAEFAGGRPTRRAVQGQRAARAVRAPPRGAAVLARARTFWILSLSKAFCSSLKLQM